MSYTKRHLEKAIEENLDYWIGIDIEYQYWKEHRINLMEEALAEQEEIYQIEINDEKFQEDLTDYLNNYNEIWG